MPICHKHKFIFIHIPKNAGTSITETFNMDDKGHHFFNYYKDKYPTIWQSYKKIAILRNPWDRVVSNYEYARLEKSYWHSSENDRPYGQHPDYNLLKDISFEECVNILFNNKSSFKHQGWSNQNEYISIDGKIMVDELINQSDIKNYIKKEFNIDLLEINKSRSKSYKEYYNQDLIDKVYQIYKDDVNLFNFNY